MKKDSIFFQQAALMLRVLPVVHREKCFGLKGGTAINLFVRDMPRLSVDIDLTYLPIEDRATSLAGISAALGSMSKGVRVAIPDARVQETLAKGGDRRIMKLVVNLEDLQIKIEPNEILRGSVYGIEERVTSPSVNKTFETSSPARCLSVPDLYAGKLCAMLDRQHPRDMFDAKQLLEHDGITPEIRKAFVVYLAGHSRPMEELLAPRMLDMESVYQEEFVGMPSAPVSYQELCEARKTIVTQLQKDLDEKERRFLLSIMQQEPAWDLLGISGLERLPSLQWKLRNVEKMSDNKKAQAIRKLEEVLGR